MAQRRKFTVVLEHAALVTGLIVLYYLIPIGEGSDVPRVGLGAALFLLGVAVLVWVFARHTLAVARRDRQARVGILLYLLYAATSFFALSYYAVARIDGDQFADLHTRTDALYFTVATIATVGFGDVHAVGQLARALVTVQMAFDLVIIAALVSAYRLTFAHRSER
ncbi:potassium channel family protein [Nonomuraea roseola]|uniref:Ion channel n=1 Tax=Nonomuraea roseola TaxID=46179 RepID=A0ABV5Q8T2_9ACTN